MKIVLSFLNALSNKIFFAILFKNDRLPYQITGLNAILKSYSNDFVTYYKWFAKNPMIIFHSKDIYYLR